MFELCDAAEFNPLDSLCEIGSFIPETSATSMMGVLLGLCITGPGLAHSSFSPSLLPPLSLLPLPLVQGLGFRIYVSTNLGVRV